MTVDYNSLDIYFHMTNHYNKLRNAKSVIDCAVSKGTDRNENKRLWPTKSKKFKNPPPFTTSCELNRRFCATSCACNNKRCCTPACLHTPIHSYGLKKHDCLTKSDKTGRSSSVPVRNSKIIPKDSKNSGRAKSVEPLVRKVPFSKFSCQKRNSGSSRSSRPGSVNKDLVQSSSPIPTNENPKSETPRSISRGDSTCPRVEEHEYLHFLLKITEDILRNELYSSSEMQKVFDSHMEANKDHLDMKKMKEEIECLKRELAESITKTRQKISSNFCLCDPKKEELLKRLENCECSNENITNCRKETCKGNKVPVVRNSGSIQQDNGRVSFIMNKNNEFNNSSESVATSSELNIKAEELTLSGSVNVESQTSRISEDRKRLYDELNKEYLQYEGLEAVSEEPNLNDDPSMSSFEGVGGDLPGFENLEPKKSFSQDVVYADASTSTKDNRPDEPSQVSVQSKEIYVEAPKQSECVPLSRNQNADNCKPAQVICNYPTLLKEGTEPDDGLKPAEIVFHTRSNASCHCNIAFRKVALKIACEESDPSAYVLIDGPVCLPKSLLETRGVPVLLENASSFFLDADGKVHSNQNYSKVDTLSNVNYLIDAHEIPIDYAGVSVSRQIIESTSTDQIKPLSEITPPQIDPTPYIEPLSKIDNAPITYYGPLNSDINKLLLDDYDLTPQRDEPGDKYHYLLRDATTSFHRNDADEADRMWRVPLKVLKTPPLHKVPKAPPREKERVPTVTKELVPLPVPVPEEIFVVKTESVPVIENELLPLPSPPPPERRLTRIDDTELPNRKQLESVTEIELAPVTQNLLLAETYENPPKLHDNSSFGTESFEASYQLEQLFENNDSVQSNTLLVSESISNKTIDTVESKISNMHNPEYADFLTKLDKIPTLKMTDSQEKQVADITDNLRKFRDLEEDEEAATYRAYTQKGGEEELFAISKSLASDATTKESSNNTQLEAIPSSTNQKESGCCGMVKAKKKGKNVRNNYDAI